MQVVFRWVKYVVLLAVVALLLATLAVFVFGLISTVVVVFEGFQHGQFNAEGARSLSVELIEMIDLFLLGTILLVTAIGLQELFVDPELKESLPEWMSVAGLDELKFNLLIVVIVMLAVLFLGAIAGFEFTEGTSILDLGVAVALVLAGLGVATYLFAKVLLAKESAERLESGTEHGEAGPPGVPEQAHSGKEVEHQA